MADRDVVLQRAGGVVWRCAPDRVITLRVGDRSERAVNELHGAAAVVWLALDEPATSEQLTVRLADADIDTDWVDGLARLRASGLVIDSRQVAEEPT
jgi:hypothetical protein